MKLKTENAAATAGKAAPGRPNAVPPPPWSEVIDEHGQPRPSYGPLLERLGALPRGELRLLDQRMEAAMRELGVTFDLDRDRTFGQKAWSCDLLPHVFSGEEWSLVVRGLRQRMKAFEFFLRDIYSHQEILRHGGIPIPPVLGSPQFQRPAVRLEPTRGRYLHLGAVCLKREPNGALHVSSQHFGHATGISYMVQNRRVLARVAPETFSDLSVASIAETPTAILEALRDTSDLSYGDPLIVMLSPGPGNPFYTEHSFLARRMGIPLVQGGDLLVLDDNVYLKTIGGLERVHVIYNRVVDHLLDPMVLERGSVLGVPGLVHCLRKKTVALVNSLGSQLADDRALLAFAPRIIRFYLGEAPLLPTMPTYWCGDLDQRELVLGRLDEFRILPRTGDRIFGNRRGLVPNQHEEQTLRAEIRKSPHLFVAQPIAQGAKTLCFEEGRQVERRQDQLVFALHKGNDLEVFPGALTRVAPEGSLFTAAGLGGGSKDTWVLSADAEPITLQSRPRRPREIHLPSRFVTSRVAEVFYWMGRYLERAHNLAYIIQAVEILELEELNATERKLYRPMWNRLLPHLEGSGRRSVATPCDRYRLVLQRDEPGALINVLRRSLNNAEEIQDSLSPEAWSALSRLRSTFARQRFVPDPTTAHCARVTRKLAELTTQTIPQFFGLAEISMMDDDGWRFCRLGQQLERAIITANAPLACSKAFTGPADRPLRLGHHTEIELSAFLRLLGTRDAYRRVYQMRAEPLPVLKLLFQNAEAPRSVLHGLSNVAALLRATHPGAGSGATHRPLAAVEAFCEKLRRIDWGPHFEHALPAEEDINPPAAPTLLEETQPAARFRATERLFPGEAADGQAPAAEPGPSADRTHGRALMALLNELLRGTMDLHHVIADVFLNHQAHITTPKQSFLRGFSHRDLIGFPLATGDSSRRVAPSGMDFEVTHVTDYSYQYAAAEAYLEARLTPPDLPSQTVRGRRLTIDPPVKVSGYTDYFGNAVDFFSLPYRHRSLVITSRMDVQTHAPARPGAALEVSINEARQILHSAAAEVFDYLQPTEIVVHTRDAAQWAKRYLRGNRPLGEALEALNLAVNEQFAYASGSTTNSTPLATVWQQRKGVCQDFTHIMLSVLRMAGLPSRYVCGYIEAVAPPSAEAGNTLGRAGRTLIGAVATHAWVEVLVPGKEWVALDPTNKQWCGERHITVSRGRDFRDATPVRGTFKGTGKQTMKVKVFVKRRVPPAPPAVAAEAKKN